MFLSVGATVWVRVGFLVEFFELIFEDGEFLKEAGVDAVLSGEAEGDGEGEEIDDREGDKEDGGGVGEFGLVCEAHDGSGKDAAEEEEEADEKPHDGVFFTHFPAANPFECDEEGECGADHHEDFGIESDVVGGE